MQHPKEVIVMTMQQIIQQFQDEVMEAHLRKLRAEDEEYQEIEKELRMLKDWNVDVAGCVGVE